MNDESMLHLKLTSNEAEEVSPPGVTGADTCICLQSFNLIAYLKEVQHISRTNSSLSYCLNAFNSHYLQPLLATDANEILYNEAAVPLHFFIAINLKFKMLQKSKKQNS